MNMHCVRIHAKNTNSFVILYRDMRVTRLSQDLYVSGINYQYYYTQLAIL